jgi:hypothetical protein
MPPLEFNNYSDEDVLLLLGAGMPGLGNDHKEKMTVDEARSRCDKFAADHQKLHENLDKILETSMYRPCYGDHHVFLRKVGALLDEVNVCSWDRNARAILTKQEPESFTSQTTEPTNEELGANYSKAIAHARAPTPTHTYVPQQVPVEKTATPKLSTQMAPNHPAHMSLSDLAPINSTNAFSQAGQPNDMTPPVQNEFRVAPNSNTMAQSQVAQVSDISQLQRIQSTPTPSRAMAHLMPASTPSSMVSQNFMHANHFSTLNAGMLNTTTIPKAIPKRKRKSASVSPAASMKLQKLSNNFNPSPAKPINYSQYHTAILGTPQQFNGQQIQQSPLQLAHQLSIQNQAQGPQPPMRNLTAEEMTRFEPRHSEPFHYQGEWHIRAQVWYRNMFKNFKFPKDAHYLGDGKVQFDNGRTTTLGHLAKGALVAMPGMLQLAPPQLQQKVTEMRKMMIALKSSTQTQGQMFNQPMQAPVQFQPSMGQMPAQQQFSDNMQAQQLFPNQMSSQQLVAPIMFQQQQMQQQFVQPQMLDDGKPFAQSHMLNNMGQQFNQLPMFNQIGQHTQQSAFFNHEQGMGDMQDQSLFPFSQDFAALPAPAMNGGLGFEFTSLDTHLVDTQSSKTLQAEDMTHGFGLQLSSPTTPQLTYSPQSPPSVDGTQSMDPKSTIGSPTPSMSKGRPMKHRPSPIIISPLIQPHITLDTQVPTASETQNTIGTDTQNVPDTPTESMAIDTEPFSSLVLPRMPLTPNEEALGFRMSTDFEGVDLGAMDDVEYPFGM